MLSGAKKVVSLGLEYLALACAALAALGLTTIVGIIVTSVIMRKFANTPLHITEEVVGLLLSVAFGTTNCNFAQQTRACFASDNIRERQGQSPCTSFGSDRGNCVFWLVNLGDNPLV